jgi:hypothetical protein
MRALVLPMLAGLLVLTVSACGRGSDPPMRRAPLTSIARSRAHVVAPLLTIRQADLPEFKVTAHAASRESPRAGTEVRCAGLGRRGPQQTWAAARSEQISANSGYQTLGAWSRAEIVPTAHAARGEIAAARRRVCMEHLIRSGVLRSRLRAHVRGITVEPLQANVEGADASAAYRTIVAARGVPLVIYLDTIFFSYGQDVFALGAYHFSKPVPPEMEQRLQELLLARAKSHSR